MFHLFFLRVSAELLYSSTQIRILAHRIRVKGMRERPD